jgi:transcriptional regulator with XRE-family HTH domain
MGKKTIFSDDYLFVIEKLKDARLDTKMNQEQVAQKIGKKQSYISKIETGERRIDIIELYELARLYKKSLYFFLPKGKRNKK